jgi:hypothetical protein
MSKIVCKNGCSGRERFHIEGSVRYGGQVDENGEILDWVFSELLDVRFIQCNECDDERKIADGDTELQWIITNHYAEDNTSR